MNQKKKKTWKQKIAIGMGILTGIILIFAAIIAIYLGDCYRASKSFQDYQIDSRVQMEERNRMIKLSPLEKDNEIAQLKSENLKLKNELESIKELQLRLAKLEQVIINSDVKFSSNITE